MDVRIELAVGLDLDEALLGQRRAQLAMDEPNALLQAGLLVLLRGDERALEIVEDRQELLHEPLVGPHDQGRLVALHPLAVVVEVRGDPLEVVEEADYEVIDEETVKTIEERVEALKAVADGDDTAQIRAKSEELMEAAHKLAQAVYEKVQAELAAAQPSAGNGEASDDEVVEEADYEVIDEEAKRS